MAWGFSPGFPEGVEAVMSMIVSHKHARNQ